MFRITTLAALAAFTVAPVFAQEAALPATTTDDADDIKSGRILIINTTNQPVSIKAGDRDLGQPVQAMQAGQWQTITATDDDADFQLQTAAGQKLGDANLELGDRTADKIVVVTADKDDANDVDVKVHSMARDADRPGDKPTVTLINASKDVEAADLFVGDKKVHSGVNPGDKNGPDETDAAGNLRVMNGRTNSEIRLDQTSLQPGQRNIVVVLSNSEAKLISDTGAGATMGARTRPATSGGTDALRPGAAPSDPNAPQAAPGSSADRPAPQPNTSPQPGTAPQNP